MERIFPFISHKIYIKYTNKQSLGRKGVGTEKKHSLWILFTSVVCLVWEQLWS